MRKRECHTHNATRVRWTPSVKEKYVLFAGHSHFFTGWVKKGKAEKVEGIFSALMAKIKCSICSYQLNLW